MSRTNGIVEFRTASGVGKGYLAVPKKIRGGILVLHAWWGLNDFCKSFCNRLALEGYVAFAPDLHHGKVTGTISEAKELMVQRNFELNRREVAGAVDYLCLTSRNTACVPGRFFEGRFLSGVENRQFPPDRGEKGRVSKFELGF